MLKIRIAALMLMLLATTAYACNIPVFRYALERWKADDCELLVFHDGPLDEKGKQLVDALQSQSTNGGGFANARIQTVDVQKAEVQNRAVWRELNEKEPRSLPYALVRASHARGPITAWDGQLEEVASQVLESPLRKRLTERLLNGDSIVWLLLKSPDEGRNEAVRKLIKTQSAKLATKLQLPDGIGLPGSELHSEVPLFLKFTSLELDRSDAQEQFLVRLFSGFQPQAYADNQPLVIPVFGRGRALEVIPADQLDAKLFEELTLFLCGACSCQVKESNPGFDLLLSADWNRELFGENGALPPPPKTVADQGQSPKLLPIAPGRKK
ncbi:MAG: hypothetical protein SFV81_03240 [Pirellulaceae bacterium]|nr:hypothetical protein [Pirellulaceae bacterium]